MVDRANVGISSSKSRVNTKKYLAKIDRVKEQNERVSRERAEIKESVDGSLRLISNALAEPSLSAKDRVRLQWIQKSVEGAKSKIVDGENYSVEVLDNNGKVNAHRLEGLPVDELITVVQRLRALTEKQVRQAHRTEAGIEGSRRVKEKYELESVRANISGEEIACQVVGLTAGVSPNIAFLKDTEINAQKAAVCYFYGLGFLLSIYRRTFVAQNTPK